jgi:hypothetical protein
MSEQLLKVRNRNNFSQEKLVIMNASPYSELEVNGVSYGEVPPGMIIEVEVTDGTDPVTPDAVSLVGNTLTIEVPAQSSGWVRNPDWISLPTITSLDNKLVALFLVFENEYNVMTVNCTNLAADIDYGDGTTTTSNGSVQSHVYDYASISGTVSQYYDGRNYKQVIIDITYSGSGTLTSVDLSPNTTVNSGGCINIVDLDCSLPSTTALRLGGARRMNIVEQIKVRDLGLNAWNAAALFMFRLRSLDFPFEKLTQLFNSSFSGIENFGNLDLSNATNLGIAFSTGYHYTFGNITSPLNTTFVRTFESCRQLRRVESVDCTSCTTIQQMFNGCEALNYVVLNNCGLITTTTNAFSSNTSLSTLLLNGITVGFSVANCKMDEAALNALFTSLGTASGSQTIIVTGNPGAATCDTTIATGKGFTVTV